MRVSAPPIPSPTQFGDLLFPVILSPRGVVLIPGIRGMKYPVGPRRFEAGIGAARALELSKPIPLMKPSTPRFGCVTHVGCSFHALQRQPQQDQPGHHQPADERA